MCSCFKSLRSSLIIDDSLGTYPQRLERPPRKHGEALRESLPRSVFRLRFHPFFPEDHTGPVWAPLSRTTLPSVAEDASARAQSANPGDSMARLLELRERASE